MRLHRLRVTGYRVHRDITVAFDPGLTVIGGPNESGKSTLMEAAHRALFLKARTGGTLLESMISATGGGPPGVECEFDAAGARHTLRKSFRGSSGTTTLQTEGEEALHGEEAEEKLAALLGTGAAAGGRGAANRVREQWAHLWVWQGSAANDPSDSASAHIDDLVDRLQELGGGATMQSSGDARVAAAFAAEYERLFTKRGTPRADSLLATAQARRDEAARKEAEAATRVSALQAAVQALDESDATLEIQRAAREQAGQELDKRRADLKKAAEIEGAMARFEEAWKRLDREHVLLVEKDREIRQAEADIEKGEQAAEPQAREVERLAGLRREAAARHQEAVRVATRAREATTSARRAHARAQAQLDLARAEEELTRVRDQVKEVDARCERSARLRVEHAALPAIDAARLGTLRKLDGEAKVAREALRAMGARIEVVESSEAVALDGRVIAAGETCSFDQDVELAIGRGTRLRLSPGSHAGMADAANRAAEAEACLARALDEHGVADIEKAESASHQRAVLATGMKELQAAVEAMQPDRLRASAEAIETRVAQLRLAVQDHGDDDSGSPDGQSAPPTPDTLDLCEEAEKAAADEAHRALARLEAATSAHEESSTAHVAATARLNEARTRVGVLEREYGGSEERGRRLATLAQERDQARSAGAAIRAELESMQPGQLRADAERFERVLQTSAQAISEAEQQRAVALSTLATEGSIDPHRELEEARADLARAEDHLCATRQHAEAIRLLDETFSRVQQEVAEQFSAPLADRVGDYLAALFGPGASAALQLDDDRVTGLALVRSGADGTHGFEALSGGTREQVAAAFRLAMAEILATSHDGCLPVVFDDAFAYADPTRLATLQRMLDLAARRGLQVIILTCTPADYAPLGARTVMLPAAPRTEAD